MSDEMKAMEAREFWLAAPDCDFDLNWKKVFAAEFPHKNTLVDSIHVIEFSAYEVAIKERDRALAEVSIKKDIIEGCAHTISQLQKEVIASRARAEKLAEALRSFSCTCSSEYGMPPYHVCRRCEALEFGGGE